MKSNIKIIYCKPYTPSWDVSASLELDTSNGNVASIAVARNMFIMV